MSKVLTWLMAFSIPFVGMLHSESSLNNIVEESPVSEPRNFCFFLPPSGWELIDPAQLSPKVVIGFAGKTKKNFCPSMNLAIERTHVTQNEYIKAVKALHEADRNNRWRELGKIKTHSGTARLTEIDTKTELGSVRILQLILVKENYAYILTAAASKEEFSSLYKDIQEAFHSLTITSDLFSAISQPQKKEELKNYHGQLIASWKEKLLEKKVLPSELFADGEFQEKFWMPFQNFVTKEFSDLGTHWQVLMLRSVHEEFLASEIKESQTDS